MRISVIRGYNCACATLMKNSLYNYVGWNHAGEIQVTAEENKMEWEWPKLWQIVMLATYWDLGTGFGRWHIWTPVLSFWRIPERCFCDSWCFQLTSYLRLLASLAQNSSGFLPAIDMDVLEILVDHLGFSNESGLNDGVGDPSSPSNKNGGRSCLGLASQGCHQGPQLISYFHSAILGMLAFILNFVLSRYDIISS